MAKSESDKGPAYKKRSTINNVRQQMTLVVLVTSIVFGVCLVFAIFFIKNINFNTKIIEGVDKSIGEYEKTIINVGVCIDNDKDGKISTPELNACDPNDIDVNKVPNTLRYNVMSSIANDLSLESIARQSQDVCFDKRGTLIDFQKKYNNSRTDSERELYIGMIKICSALRVIPDALPSTKNTEALMSSVNHLFEISNNAIESLSPSDNYIASGVNGVNALPVSIQAEGCIDKIVSVLDNFESSIRTFDVQNAVLEWRSSTDCDQFVEVRAQAKSYYSQPTGVTETDKVIYASDKGKKAAKEKK